MIEQPKPRPSIHALVQEYRDPGLGYAYYRLLERLYGVTTWTRIPNSELCNLFAVSPNVVTRYTDTLSEHGLILKLNRRSGSRTLSYYRPAQNQKPNAKSETAPSHNLRSVSLNNLINDDDNDDAIHYPGEAGKILKDAGIRHAHTQFSDMLAMDTDYLKAWADYVRDNVRGNPAGYMIKCILRGDPVPGTEQQPTKRDYSTVPEDPPVSSTPAPLPVTPAPLKKLYHPLEEPAASEWRMIRLALEANLKGDYHQWRSAYPLYITQDELALVPVNVSEVDAHRWKKTIEKYIEFALNRSVQLSYVFNPEEVSA